MSRNQHQNETNFIPEKLMECQKSGLDLSNEVEEDNPTFSYRMSSPQVKAKPKLTMTQKVVQSVQGVERAANGNCCMNILVILTLILFAAVLFVNFLSSNPSKSCGLFHYGVSNVSRLYPLDITPAGWTFSIWGLIYLLQMLWVLYSLTLLCRRTPSGPALNNPPVLTASFFTFFNITSILNIAWLIFWDRLLFMACFLFLFCQSLSLYLTIASVAGRIVYFRETLIDAGRKMELVFINITVLNGVAMYATWVTVATTLNLGTVLQYKWFEPLPSESVSVICLAVVAACILTYVVLDFSILEMYTRFCIAPYFTITWALAGILSRNWNGADLKMSSIIAAVMLGAVMLVTLVKVVLSYYRTRVHAYQYRLMKSGRRP